jgi:hypothetical protein
VTALEVDLGRTARTRLLIALSFINVALGATTGAFIVAWERLGGYSPSTQRFIKYFLVQGHLATENVVAAWYSSMLLLMVALAAIAACSVDRRSRRGNLSWGWTLMGLAFAGLSLDEIGSFHERIGMVRELSSSGEAAAGWVFVLGIPIGVVALFLLAFATLHVRRVPAAFRWMVAGVGLFLSNPAFELVEMRLIHGAGADPATWQRTVHDLLLVLEEGVLELFGILCFLAAALTYLGTVAGPRVSWTFNTLRARWLIRGLTALAIMGVFVSAWVVSKLPPGDTGIPSNWFPAAMLMVAGIAMLTVRSGRGWMKVAGAVLLALSAFCGAGLYGYFRLLFYGAPLVAAFVTALGGWALEAAVEAAVESRTS